MKTGYLFLFSYSCLLVVPSKSISIFVRVKVPNPLIYVPFPPR